MKHARTKLSFLITAACAKLAACATVPQIVPRPEFPQRAAPREGQSEIELLAGLDARVAIRDGCLGVVPLNDPEGYFRTIIWPAGAGLERDDMGWIVRNTQNGEIVRVGGKLSGSGGNIGDFTGEELSRYNRYLTRDLSARCAAFGAFTLNADFRARR